jgi:hypothetical protein
MLAQRGQGYDQDHDTALEAAYALHLRRVQNLLAHDARFTAISVAYADVVADPTAVATRIQTFLGTDLDTERMAAAVDRRLYHHRSTLGV